MTVPRSARRRLFRPVAMAALIALAATSCAWIGRASVTTGGAEADGASSQIALSFDGRYAVYQSTAANLTSLSTFGLQQIYRHDFVTGTTELVSRQFGGCNPCTGGNGGSADPDISADGRYVVFWSNADNFVTDTNNVSDVFRVDMVAGAIERVSVSTAGAQAIAASFDPTVSADGTKVTFAAYDALLTAGDLNVFTDIFLHDIAGPTTIKVSESTTGAATDGDSSRPVISSDGSAIAYATFADNAVVGTGIAPAAVLYRSTGSTVLSASFTGLPPVANQPQAIDADGNRIVIYTGGILASAAVFDDTGLLIQSLNLTPLSDIDDSGTRLVSQSAVGSSARLTDLALPANSGAISQPLTGGTLFGETVIDIAISGDGRTGGFSSDSTVLVNGDTNAVTDVFAKSIPFVTVTAVNPATMPAGQVTNVTITGSGFDDPTLTVGGFGVRATVSNVTLVDANTITATITVDPANPLGLVSPFVSVDNPGTGPQTGASGICDDCVTIT